MDQRTIVHLDVDAFFASAEQLLDPSLSGRPVIVGGFPSDRGVVASCSYEARAAGVHAGMALRQARRCCPAAVFLKGDFHNYQRIQTRIRETLIAFSPTVEFSSIDDAYLDLTGLDRAQGAPLETAVQIRQAVLDRTGLSVSVGVGSSKVVARIASGCAKPGGVLLVLPGYERHFLRELDVRQLPGIGPLTERILGDLGVRTIGHLAALKSSIVHAIFGRKGTELSRLANAEDSRTVNQRVHPRSISRETTFPRVAGTRREVEAMLHYLTERAVSALREQALFARALEIKIVDDRYVRTARRRTFAGGPTGRVRFVQGEALALLEELMPRKVRVRLVGVTLLSTEPRSNGFQHRLPLGRSADPLREENLCRGIERIREKFGFGALTAGRSIDLLGKVRRTERGFVLRTPSLTR